MSKKRPIKRYVLFSNVFGYPDSGWDAFGGDYDTLRRALIAAKTEVESADNVGVPFWWHIVDVKKREIVAER